MWDSRDAGGVAGSSCRVVSVERRPELIVRPLQPARIRVLELRHARPHDRREVPEVHPALLDRPRRERVPHVVHAAMRNAGRERPAAQAARRRAAARVASARPARDSGARPGSADRDPDRALRGRFRAPTDRASGRAQPGGAEEHAGKAHSRPPSGTKREQTPRTRVARPCGEIIAFGSTKPPDTTPLDLPPPLGEPRGGSSPLIRITDCGSSRAHCRVRAANGL